MAAVPVKMKKGSRYLQHDNSWGNKGSALVFDTKSRADAKRKELELKATDVAYEAVPVKKAAKAAPRPGARSKTPA